VQPLSEKQHLLRSVYSRMLAVQIIPFLYKTETGEKGVGHSQERGRERERDKRIKGVGGRA
jgi:hypothetical protein